MLALSVVIPTRDRPALLDEVLDRLAPGRQTLAADRYEVVVSDDGDAEATRRRLATRCPWVRVVPGPRRGPAANRNTGARAATAPWIAFTDDDTRPDPGWLAALLAAADDVDVVEGRTTCRDGLTSPLTQSPQNPDGGWWWSCNLAVRRDLLLDRLGGFDERFPAAHMEDVDLRTRARALGMRERFARDAVVDHPPRRVDQRRRAAAHASWVAYQAIHRPPPRRGPLLRETVRHRLRDAARAPLSLDGLRLLGFLPRELWHITRHWDAWVAAAPPAGDAWSPAHAARMATTTAPPAAR